MGFFLLPISLCDELQRIINSFWWGSKVGGQKKIHWATWERLCIRKEYGGVGFRHLFSFNLAMLGKQNWHFITRPSALSYMILKDKYFFSGDFLNSSLGLNMSLVCMSIWKVKSIIAQGYR